MLTSRERDLNWWWTLAELRAAQLYQGTVSVVGPTTIYTVPAGKRVILKYVALQNQTGLSVTVQLRLPNANTIWAIPLTAYGTATDREKQGFWIVLNPGDTIAIGLSAARTVAVSISGSVHSI